jgi:pimeloyl-ACP methyl ester carboxylesterase
LQLEPGSFKTRGEIDLALAGVIPDRTVRQFFLTNIGRDEAGRPAWKINLQAIRANYDSLNEATPGVPPVLNETLFLLGGRSRHVGVQDEPSILQVFPAAQFSVVGGADHWVHADAPERFCQVVRIFLGG